MDFKNYRTFCSILLLIVITCQSICSVSCSTRKLLGLKHKGTIKTIKTNDGEVIDCVDIYKQPAFNHPPIKDLKMNPTSYPVGIEALESKSNTKLQQDWHIYGKCPKGSIPIRRSTSSNNHTMSTRIEHQSNGTIKLSSNGFSEYAMASDTGNYYYGAYGMATIWRPRVEKGEFSTSKIWLVSNELQVYNSIEAGWTVYPERYKDDRPRVFIRWTSGSKGCFDFDCNGFVQTSALHAIGAALAPISSYGKRLFDMTFTIFQDTTTGDWWLRLGTTNIGYWPKSLFTSLAKHATIVNWGGEILNERSGGHHTTTQMGSGHFSSEGYGKAALTSLMNVVDSSYTFQDPGLLKLVSTKSECYDIKVGKNQQSGHFIYFGGPGFSSTCP